ncbi:PREDICTED: monocarboxylate transporter 4-like [Priapulus caudatus]|uniref:Monocarboxylate transporter 4-like n=1 Tax=Priapulus caudatus TaxID=37621 RepID=A0ABM1DUW6_PRICU|nr:PREDICTED: monocarboxylate transporter 4-like [Priapulus caudatus]
MADPAPASAESPRLNSYVSKEEAVAAEKEALAADDVVVATATRQQKDVDGGYAWIILLSIFMQLYCMMYSMNSFPVLFVELHDYFDVGRGAIAWIGSIQTATVFLIGPFSNLATQRFGVRWCMIVCGIIAALGQAISFFATDHFFLYLSYGVVTGIGLGGSHLPALYSVGLYFEKRRYVVTALAFAGGAVSVMIAGPLTNYLIANVGWRGTCLINAGFCLQIVIAGALQRPKHIKNVKNRVTLHKIFAMHLFKDPKMSLFTANTFLWSQGLMIVLILSIDYVVSMGVPRSQAAWLTTTMGICTFVVRLIIAFVGHVPTATTWMFNISSIAHGACGVLLLAWNNIVYYHIIIGIFGLSYGIKIAIVAMLTMDMFGLHNFLAVYSIQMCAIGFGSLLGIPLAAWAYDISNSYITGFVISGVLVLVAVILFFIVMYLEHKEHKKGKDTLENKEVECTTPALQEPSSEQAPSI